MYAVCDVTNQLQQTIAAMKTNPPNNVPYHEDAGDHPAPGFYRRDSRQANRYRGPPTTAVPSYTVAAQIKAVLPPTTTARSPDWSTTVT